jgi:hypothetical protein
LFSKQAVTLRGQTVLLERDRIKYSDYALSLLCVQKEQSVHYTSAQVGPKEWLVRRTGIVTDKIRHVSLLDQGSLTCDCMMYAECEVACRHVIAVCRDNTRLRDQLANVCGKQWLNSLYIDCFKNFHVIMPSAEQERAVGQTIFPEHIKMPPKKSTRGRPRVKRIKTRGPRLPKNHNRNGHHDGRRTLCTVCRKAGHTRPMCPVRREFVI